MHTPVISVLMAIYNGERFAKEAIESILDQTFTDFELILIDDCSTDNTLQIMKQYDDPRIVIIENERNLGLAKSLNRGLDVARGKYIARMDADDISIPDRFSKQIDFLEKHFDIDVCGSWIKSIDINGNSIIFGESKFPLSSNMINCYLLFDNPIAHPTVMFRKRIFQKIDKFNPEFIVAQDYDLWTRTIEHFKISNIPEFLLNYRRHGGSISYNREKFFHEEYKIRKRAIENLLAHSLSSDEGVALSNLINPRSKMQLNEIFLIDDLFLKIFKTLILTNKMSQDELNEINLFFANQALFLAGLSKPISKIACIKLIIHGFRYHPATLLIILKKIITIYPKNIV